MALGTMEFTPFLQFERFRFSLRVKSLMVLPPYKGSIFRGAFGATFRRIVCPARQNDCRSCLLRARCLYVALFDPPAPPGYPDERKYSQAPPPYVLNPPLTSRQAFHPGETLDFELVLIGPAIDALPYFVFAFQEMGKKGLGRERGRYDLELVELLRGEESLPVFNGHSGTLRSFTSEPPPIRVEENGPIDHVTLQFLTPLRLKVKGDLVTQLTFPIFFERLVHRITLLSIFYGTPDNLPDFSPFIAQAQDIKVVKDRLHWYDWERYSGSQKDSMKLGGLKGSVVISGSLSPYFPVLCLGQALNTGQATTFGLGRYELNAVDLSIL